MDTLVLIVTFNGESTIGLTLERILAMQGIEHCLVMVVDNASTDGTASIVAHRSDRLTLVRSERNLGVAAAYNRGLAEARRRGMQWMLIFDQDTEAETDLLYKLRSAGDSLLSGTSRVGAVAPMAVNRQYREHIYTPYQWLNTSLVPINVHRESRTLFRVDSTITSGTLYNTRALQDINGFREDYFIDFVDHECHMRMKLRGWQLWYTKESKIFHCLGKYQKMMGHGLWLEHSPFRYYYMVRNMLEGFYRLCGIRGGLSFAAEVLGHGILVWKYSGNRGEILRYMLKGAVRFFMDRFRKPF